MGDTLKQIRKNMAAEGLSQPINEATEATETTSLLSNGPVVSASVQSQASNPTEGEGPVYGPEPMPTDSGRYADTILREVASLGKDYSDIMSDLLVMRGARGMIRAGRLHVFANRLQAVKDRVLALSIKQDAAEHDEKLKKLQQIQEEFKLMDALIGQYRGKFYSNGGNYPGYYLVDYDPDRTVFTFYLLAFTWFSSLGTFFAAVDGQGEDLYYVTGYLMLAAAVMAFSEQHYNRHNSPISSAWLLAGIFLLVLALVRDMDNYAIASGAIMLLPVLFIMLSILVIRDVKIFALEEGYAGVNVESALIPRYNLFFHATVIGVASAIYHVYSDDIVHADAFISLLVIFSVFAMLGPFNDEKVRRDHTPVREPVFKHWGRPEERDSLSRFVKRRHFEPEGGHDGIRWVHSNADKTVIDTAMGLAGSVQANSPGAADAAPQSSNTDTTSPTQNAERQPTPAWVPGPPSF